MRTIQSILSVVILFAIYAVYLFFVLMFTKVFGTIFYLSMLFVFLYFAVYVVTYYLGAKRKIHVQTFLPVTIVSVVAFFIQIVMGTIFIIVAHNVEVSLKVFLSIQVPLLLLLVAYVAIMLKGSFFIAENRRDLLNGVQNCREIVVKLNTISMMVSSVHEREMISNLAYKFKYAQSSSLPEVMAIEQMIFEQISFLQECVYRNDTSGIMKSVTECYALSERREETIKRERRF